ncbi:MAG: glycosyltransferase family 2 protein [Rhodospirillales bacterium]|nr:glycosyltransferase family 2 protein [Rhodospirillales bacterium]
MSIVPAFSLVLSTKDRTEELARFLRSLDAQSERSFELIVSDQNSDDRLTPILRPYEARFPLRRVRSSGGISRGRNAGIPLARGRIVAFPDDDCWYPDDVLATVLRLFEANPDWDVVSGRSVDDRMRDTQGRWLDHVVRADRRNVLRMGISYTIFARASALPPPARSTTRWASAPGPPGAAARRRIFCCAHWRGNKTSSTRRRSLSTTPRRSSNTRAARAIASMPMLAVLAACWRSTTTRCLRRSVILGGRLRAR